MKLSPGKAQRGAPNRDKWSGQADRKDYLEGKIIVTLPYQSGTKILWYWRGISAWFKPFSFYALLL